MREHSAEGSSMLFLDFLVSLTCVIKLAFKLGEAPFLVVVDGLTGCSYFENVIWEFPVGTGYGLANIQPVFCLDLHESLQ